MEQQQPGRLQRRLNRGVWIGHSLTTNLYLDSAKHTRLLRLKVKEVPILVRYGPSSDGQTET